jgi:hypothetical protein
VTIVRIGEEARNEQACGAYMVTRKRKSFRTADALLEKVISVALRINPQNKPNEGKENIIL